MNSLTLILRNAALMLVYMESQRNLRMVLFPLYYYSDATVQHVTFISQCFSFCPAGCPARTRLWVRLNVCVNVFASIKQTSSRWEFVSRICLAASDSTLTANLISLVVTKELSRCDQEHQSVFEGISSKWRNTSCIKSAKNKHSIFIFPGLNWKKNTHNI